MATTWSVIVDFDDDGSFEAGEELITSVSAAEWSLGMAAYAAMETETFCRVVLDDRAGLLGPEVAANVLSPGKRIQITSNDGTARTHFTGYTRHIERDAAGNLVILADTMTAQLDQSVRIGLQTAVTADGVITEVLDQCRLRLANVGNLFYLDESLLDGSDVLGGVAVTPSLDTGVTTFDYVGDTYEGGVLAARAIRDIVEAEGGRFYVRRDGEFVFKNRTALYLDVAPVTTWTDAVRDFGYSYGKHYLSRAEIEVTPRSVGSADSVLWQLDHVMRFAANSSRAFVVVYRDADKRRIGSIDAGYVTGFVFNTEQDGSGSVVTGAVTVGQDYVDSSSKVVTVINPLPYPVYLMAGAQVLGTPLNQDDAIVVAGGNEHSSFLYEERVRRRSLPVLTDVEDAANLAAFDVARRSVPVGAMDYVVVDEAVIGSGALSVTLFDRVAVVDTKTGNNAEYLVVRETHKLAAGVHEARFDLERGFEGNFFTLDVSVLDGAAVLAY